MSMEIPVAVWIQYPVALILLFAVFYLLREFRAFIRERDNQWQGFLREQQTADKEQRSSDQESIRSLVAEVKHLAQELVNLRGDFDRAVATMRERTRPRGDE